MLKNINESLVSVLKCLTHLAIISLFLIILLHKITIRWQPRGILNGAWLSNMWSCWRNTVKYSECLRWMSWEGTVCGCVEEWACFWEFRVFLLGNTQIFYETTTLPFLNTSHSHLLLVSYWEDGLGWRHAGGCHQMWCQGNMWCKWHKPEISQMHFHFSERPNGFLFISLALRGFLLFPLLLSSSLMGFCMAAMAATASNLALTYSISSLTSNGWISETVNGAPPSVFGWRRLPPRPEVLQEATTAWWRWQQMLSSLLLCSHSATWLADSVQTLFIHFTRHILDIIMCDMSDKEGV